MIDVSLICELPESFAALERAAQAEGYRHLTRLGAEYRSGQNRFDQPGEALFAATSGRALVGIGGLNIDPYARSRLVGRVRRVYVVPAARRSGAGSALMAAIERHAQQAFQVLRLNTDSPAAAAFYEALGYQRIARGPFVSHQRALSAR